MLNKKKVLSMLTLSAFILSNGAVALADQTAPIDASTPVEVAPPVDATTPTTETPIADPVPSVPVETVEPTEPATETPVDAPVPTEPTNPSDVVVVPTSPSTTGSSTGTETSVGVTETITETANPTPDLTHPPKTAEEAINAGESQVGTVSTVTNQPVVEVTPSKPIITEAGYTIISTENSKPVIRYSDGTTATVSAESIGAVVNADKTISVKSSDGKMTTLPATGEALSVGLSVFGSLLAIGTGYLKKNKYL